MTRRTQGKITHWNEEKGYGFITPAAGAKQVFVHISAFNNRRQPPKLNQLVSFSLSKDKQGRPCAEEVTRAGEKQPRGIKRNSSNNQSRNANVGKLITIALVLFAGWFGYSRLIRPQITNEMSRKATTMPQKVFPQAQTSQFECDGRTHCSDMTSCAEATYFIKHCPNTKMDGDGDGVPCESQWCN
jgi:cold shock CspA family protein